MSDDYINKPLSLGGSSGEWVMWLVRYRKVNWFSIFFRFGPGSSVRKDIVPEFALPQLWLSVHAECPARVYFPRGSSQATRTFWIGLFSNRLLCDDWSCVGRNSWPVQWSAAHNAGPGDGQVAENTDIKSHHETGLGNSKHPGHSGRHVLRVRSTVPVDARWRRWDQYGDVGNDHGHVVQVLGWPEEVCHGRSNRIRYLGAVVFVRHFQGFVQQVQWLQDVSVGKLRRPDKERVNVYIALRTTQLLRLEL